LGRNGSNDNSPSTISTTQEAQRGRECARPRAAAIYLLCSRQSVISILGSQTTRPKPFQFPRLLRLLRGSTAAPAFQLRAAVGVGRMLSRLDWGGDFATATALPSFVARGTRAECKDCGVMLSGGGPVVGSLLDRIKQRGG